jgi:tetratricopeptide (TPR) repeat protein
MNLLPNIAINRFQIGRFQIGLAILVIFFFLLTPGYLKAQSLDKVELMANVEKGYLAHRRGDYQDAITIYTSIIKLRGLSVKERAVSYLLRGEAKRDNGDLKEAVFDFTRALTQWPNYPQAIFFRGQVLVQLNRLPEALADLNRAVELDPDRESYQTNLALLKKRMTNEGINIDGPINPLEINPPPE